MNKIALDNIDNMIIDLLKKDASTSYKEISKIIGKTEATVRRRVKRLKNDGFIKKFTVILNDKMISDKKVKAIIKIFPEIKTSKLISNNVAELSMVSEAYLLSGECGILLKVSANSIEAITDFIENQLSEIQGIKSIDTCFIMKTLKEEY
ncbi:MAG: Lrp/AsnC family transcriptional regulator [Promethearchaeota archaeon]